MAIEWASSADKHEIPREDTLYAMLHPEVTAEIVGRPGETTTVYIGHPHPQTHRYIEVIAASRPPNTVVIFHSMPLTDVFRYLLTEGE